MSEQSTNPAPTSRLDHYSIRTTRLAETVKFYTEIMNFEDGFRPAFNFPGSWLYSGGQAVVHLVGIDPNDPSGLIEYLGDKAMEDTNGTGTIDHVAFAATGLADMRRRLVATQIQFRERSVPTLSLHQVFFEDPNGVTIEMNYSGAESG